VHRSGRPAGACHRRPGRHRRATRRGGVPGLALHIAAVGARVVEADRADRQDRCRQGKSDLLDAVSAARAAQSGRARGRPKGRDGQVEAIRTLVVAKRTARSEWIQTITGPVPDRDRPDDRRARFSRHSADGLVAELASLRPRRVVTVGYGTRMALRTHRRRSPAVPVAAAWPNALKWSRWDLIAGDRWLAPPRFCARGH
jgi:hypothetical protein